MATTPMVVVETDKFLERASAILNEGERAALVKYLASSPEAGQLIPGTGGARKLRWAMAGRGKRGGARTIYYYYHDESIPLFILDIYAKSQKTDLTKNEKHSLKRILAQIPSQYKRS